MKTIVKYAAVAALTGAMALAAAPSQARSWHHNRGAVIGGFVAGAVIGAAAANAVNDGYYYGPGPYAYEPGYVDDGSYAYEPAPAYEYRSRSYPNGSCAVDMGYGRYDYSAC